MSSDFFQGAYEAHKTINAAVLDEPMRISFHNLREHYYGIVKGFSGGKYKIAFVAPYPFTSFPEYVSGSICYFPNRMEMLLYF